MDTTQAGKLELLSEVCPACGSKAVGTFLTRKGVPVHQNLLLRSREEARSVRRGDLVMGMCRHCGLVCNQAFDGSLMSYDSHYDNTQTHSPFFSQYIDERVQYLVDQHGAGERRIVEVGCGKGVFLERLIAAGRTSKGYGFDPTYEGPAVRLNGRLRFERQYYDAERADIAADLFVCRHVIEHAPQPLLLLQNIRGALTRSSHARLFLETPCVEWILRNQVVWDLFYEHCALFSVPCLRVALELAGFRVVRTEHVFGGQYLWVEAALGPPTREVARYAVEVARLMELAKDFSAKEAELINRWRSRLATLTGHQRVALWGAGAKGVTLANLVDPDGQYLTCVIDLNPGKQGCFIPGTGHPVVSYRALGDLGVTAAVLMNPNYRDENRALLQEAKLSVALVE